MLFPKTVSAFRNQEPSGGGRHHARYRGPEDIQRHGLGENRGVRRDLADAAEGRRVAIGGDEDDGRRLGFLDPANRFDAVYLSLKGYIHQDQVGMELARLVDGALAVRHHAADRAIELPQGRFQVPSDENFVLDD